MSFTRFLLGVVELAAILLPLYAAAISLRQVLVPGWNGAASRLAEIVLAISGLILVAQLVGVVGLYRPGFVIAGALIASAATILLCRRYGADRDATPLPAPPVSHLAFGLAIAGAMVVTYQWANSTQIALDIGMYLPNTTWHNAPFAARFVQEAQIGLPHYTDIFRLTVWFYPQNSELLHSVGILTLSNDVLSPLLNIGWMVLALLAGWVIGRPYGVGPAVVVALAIMFGTEMLVYYEPGDAKNDMIALFGMLAAVAFLINGEAQRRASDETEGSRPWDRFGLGPLILAALASGIAIGTRLNFLVPVLLLTLAVIYLSFPGQRLRTTGVWIAGLTLTSGFWFLRNLVIVGNPLPWAKSLGPITLPHPDQMPIDVREPGTVAEFLTNFKVIDKIFVPGIRDNLGDLWLLVIAAVVIFAVVAIVKGQTRTIRTLGVVSVLAFIGYLVTPLTAAGRSGGALSTGFEANMRYVAPAMALALVLGPLSPIFRSSQRRRRILLVVLLVILLFTVWPSAPLIGGIATSPEAMRADYALLALVLAAALVILPVGLAELWNRQHLRPLAISLSVLAGIGLFAFSYARTDNYEKVRYAEPTTWRTDPLREDFQPLIQWFRPLTDQRIGIVGSAISFKQYFLYGKELSNRVYYVGQPAACGVYRPVQTCVGFRRRVNELDLDLLVISRYTTVPLKRPAVARLDEKAWILGTPQTQVVLQSNGFNVLEVNGRLDPNTCPVE